MICTVASFILLTSLAANSFAATQISISSNASDLEIYAARELQRYLYQITGELPLITNDTATLGKFNFIVGRLNSHKLIKLPAGTRMPGPQGYILKSATLAGKPAIIIAGSDLEGVLYGVYGLLEDHYGMGFYLQGDVFPKKFKGHPENLNETKTPLVYIRGFLPWTNFPQSATVYSWEDWKFIIDQMAKMRMNLLHIHNYSGSGGHNEMFHNFRYKGHLSRVWMPTAKTGHGWSGPKWDVNEYLFGASDLFDDYDFGADCALHNENLSNEEVFAKGYSMFQKVIAYAHSRGVKIALGLDINEIPREYHKLGAEPDHPEVIEARIEQITTHYPDLDYLICFQHEASGARPEAKKIWRNSFDQFYSGIKKRSPNTKLAVAGWGLKANDVKDLPDDVICAPISAYSAGFESGKIYGDREYWGCPWLERDFRSSQYYYPYNIHLSDTIKAWQSRASNLKGLYCLTWRIADAIDPKMSYIARAPWDLEGKYKSSRDVYLEYAVKNYGEKAAETLTSIINENEPYACGFGECQPTPSFTGTFSIDTGANLFNISAFAFSDSQTNERVEKNATDYSKAKGTQRAECSEGGECLAYINAGDWIRFDDFDFGTGKDTFEARLATVNNEASFIEIRIGHQTQGQLLARVQVPYTGGWQIWKTITAPIPRTSGKAKLFLVFYGAEINDLPKAQSQLAKINDIYAQTNDPSFRYRIDLLRRRIAASRDHILLNRYFPHLDWDGLPGRFDSWMKNFTHRVTDISSLGNVQSAQNRFVQLNYLSAENEMRKNLEIAPPSKVEARGTKDGVVITWRYEDARIKGFRIYEDGKAVNQAPIPATRRSFSFKTSGRHSYRVSAIAANGKESALSVKTECEAGTADRSAPRIVVISPPVSVAQGQNAELKARILDGRHYSHISAVLKYRTPGTAKWKTAPMARRTKAVFCSVIPASEISHLGMEYYIVATDGTNKSVWPAAAPKERASFVAYPIADKEPPSAPGKAFAQEIDGKKTIKWGKASGDVFWYRIYRSQNPGFKPQAENFVTYVHSSSQSYASNGLDFDGRKLYGAYYYAITAVDKSGNESPPSNYVMVKY